MLVKIKNGVFRINNIIIKIFPDNASFEYERDAHIIAKELQLPIPEYFCIESIIIMSYMGPSLTEIINNENGTPYDMGYGVGKLLKHCHNLKVTHIKGESLRNNRKISGMMASGLITEQHLFDEYLASPGDLGYCHGDASTNNFTYCNGIIYMIDFSGLSKMGPYGIPAYEYYQFLTSIRTNIHIYTDITRQGFIAGYGPTNFTTAADNLFQTYWDCKSKEGLNHNT